MADFCHLHVHSHYSMLDGAIRIDDLIERAAKDGSPAVAVTDHGNMFGAVELYVKAKKAGVKPVVGYEAYVAPGSREDRTGGPGEGNNHHLTLLAMNEGGYRNLMRLASEAYLTGHHYKPRIDRPLLAAHSAGLIALSGCLAGEAASLASRGDAEGARSTLSWYRDLFGPERLYVELMENGIPEQASANSVLVGLAKELGLRLVATNDAHYLDRADSEAHEVLLCIGTGKRLTDENRLTFATDAFYLRPPAEMAELFAGVPEALRSTVEIAEKCDLELSTGVYHHPVFAVPEGETPAGYFRKVVEEGVRRRYGGLDDRVRERMEMELGVVERMGFIGYLLIVWDIVRFARERGIPVGPGRGSAVGSVMCYGLGITELDPLQYGLIFERFINPGRNEMPDIDLDFCQSRRGEVIDHVMDKYGRDHVAQIITFGTIAAKAGIRDVGRVMGVPLPVVNAVAKLVPEAPGTTMEKALRESPDLRKQVEEDETIRNVVEIARRLEGLARQPGTHAAGVVIADRPLVEYCPLFKNPKTGEVTTQYEMAHIDKIGLLKIDFLGLRTLTMAHTAAGFVAERTGRALDLDRLPLDDAKTFRLFQRAETGGIFQFESAGMRDILTRARPDRFEDLIALNAMYRPGPMDSISEFTDRKFGRAPIVSVDETVDPVLAPTYGVIAYQEQVMRIAQLMAGFTLSEADTLRKAMGKKNRELMDRFREKFLNGAKERGHDEGVARILWDRMAKFAEYGFNKSHAAAYAFLAYQTAYLKANYPTEFMAALLTLDAGKTEKIADHAEEARRIGLEILPPDVNASGPGFTIVRDGAIRFGLAAIKGVGDKAVESVVKARKEGGPFASLVDFCERVDLRLVNKSVLESLARAGAFDSLGLPRSRILAGVPGALEAGSRAQADRARGQDNLFDSLLGASTPEADRARPADEGLPEAPDLPEAGRLAMEKAVLGLYVSGHPLEGYRAEIERYSTTDSRALGEAKDGAEVVVGGMLAAVKMATSREKGLPYATLTLEDMKGTLAARVFSRALPEAQPKLVRDTVVFLCGRVDAKGGGSAVVLADEVLTLAEVAERAAGRVTITLREDEVTDDLLGDLRTVLAGNPGRAEVFFRIEREADGAVVVRAGQGVTASPGEQLCRDVEAVLGSDRVEVEAAAVSFTRARPRGRSRGGRRR